MLLAAVAALFLQTPDSLLGTGVSHALAELRGRTISDVRYDLSLDVMARDSAVGSVTIRFHRAGTGDAILDFRGRRLTKIVANGRELPPGAGNGAHILIPAPMLGDTNTVQVEFVSAIAPAGASIIRFHDQTDSSDYLYTLLVPSDANQLFPCFDQPDLKARVTLTITAQPSWTVVANGSRLLADSNAARVVHHFTETNPISTYLIAFAAGPWRHRALSLEGHTVGVYVRRSRAAEADLDTMMALNARALTWMETYFARPFPFEKFEFVLAPAFPFGGMEHPGAVFYNEDRFIFRERPTLPQRLGRFSTVLHEVAHMWFGDLVTMKWFDDLWLKEGFATYMAAKALDNLEPSSQAWKTFYLGNKPAAYGIDQTAGTNSLWQQLDNLDQAKSNYGAIVYNKAPSVLKQLNYLVGEDAFRRGVQAFLADHAYANATWQDLLGAVGHAANRSLAEFGRQFMLRPGMPEVELRLRVHDGQVARLTLVQHPARAAVSGNGPWPMRVQVLLWRPDHTLILPVELTGPQTDVRTAVGKVAPVFAFANFRDYGYMLTRLDTMSLRALTSGTINRVPDPFLRAMLWGAIWDEVRAARLNPRQFLAIALGSLRTETDEQIVPRLLGRVRRALTAYVDSSTRAAYQGRAESVAWQLANDPGRPYGIRKACLDAFIGIAATPDGVAKLESLLGADSVAGEPARDPTRWDVVDRLLVLGAPGAAERLAAQRERDRTADGRRRAFTAGAAVGTAEVKRDYFTRYFADTTLNEDWASGSLGAFNALEHQSLTLPYLRPALDSLRYIQSHRRIFFLGGWLGAFLGGQTSSEALQAVQQFLRDNENLPADLRRKVLENADELERVVAIRRRFN